MKKRIALLLASVMAVSSMTVIPAAADEERPTIVILIGEALPRAEGTLHISILEEVVLHIAREGVVIQADTEDFPVSHKCRILP